jgi:uncharacterized protein (DUF1499 family)
MPKAGLSLFVSVLLTLALALGWVLPAQAQSLSVASLGDRLAPRLGSTVDPLIPTVSDSSFFALFSSGGASVFSFSGKRPSTLGVKDNKLSLCPNSPNCVNSQTPGSDKQHSIAPLAYRSNPEQAMMRLKSVVQGMERTKIVTDQKDYLHVEFTTALMGFVDDVEFYLDPKSGVIHVRSASRLGQSDMGVNRKRVEEIRAKLLKLEGMT